METVNRKEERTLHFRNKAPSEERPEEKGNGQKQHREGREDRVNTKSQGQSATEERADNSKWQARHLTEKQR
eukprot:NODE_1331_length_560_cov_132.827789_g1256_i0.p1 GENE.NODE_1331_length_560_cov_132.827789_g1256_i0~~NODE_1331_length_560_cov_132.827789_g1256_i0.p1  ORF type:complete len:72 (-),score=17.89 NODE_1331_length_560_cov_132.827789_g1256_i0:217-432(-)